MEKYVVFKSEIVRLSRWVPVTFFSTAIVKAKKDITRGTLSKIDAMLGWGVVKEGDIIVAKGKGNEAVLLAMGM
jgi:PII-like signaling protein